MLQAPRSMLHVPCSTFHHTLPDKSSQRSSLLAPRSTFHVPSLTLQRPWAQRSMERWLALSEHCSAFHHSLCKGHGHSAAQRSEAAEEHGRARVRQRDLHAAVARAVARNNHELLREVHDVVDRQARRLRRAGQKARRCRSEVGAVQEREGGLRAYGQGCLEVGKTAAEDTGVSRVCVAGTKPACACSPLPASSTVRTGDSRTLLTPTPTSCPEELKKSSRRNRHPREREHG